MARSDEIVARMIGRKVTSYGIGGEAEVIRWEPFMSGMMCDVTVMLADGSRLAVASSGLRPTDGKGDLPNRREVCQIRDNEALAQLQAIRAQHVRDFGENWPGANFGKALIGNAIDSALRDTESRIKRHK